jgi:Ca2+-binding EF-hand superfamily protein
MTKVFFEFDANGDGVLQAEEFSEVLVAPHHELADSDRDEILSDREFMAHIGVLFESVDSDADGHITKQELVEAGHEEEDR